MTVEDGKYNTMNFVNENEVWKIKPQDKYFVWPLDI